MQWHIAPTDLRHLHIYVPTRRFYVANKTAIDNAKEEDAFWIYSPGLITKLIKYWNEDLPYSKC